MDCTLDMDFGQAGTFLNMVIHHTAVSEEPQKPGKTAL
jgi:hypothetical protein